MQRSAILLALCLCTLPSVAQTARFGAHLDGKPLTQLAPANAKAVVLFFVASDCPVSNRTFPEMQRLRQTYTPRGIRFLFVYPNTTENTATIAEHQHTFDPGGEAITDPSAALVHLTHAFVTPEVAILVPAPNSTWKPVYIGRIDDRFVRIGQERPQPTQFFADRALAALLAGHPVTPDSGSPVGCTILPARAVR